MNISAGKSIAVFVAVVSCSLGISHAAIGPRIQFDSLTLDFGHAAAGRVIDHDFDFVNTGDQTLEIKDVRPTCGCTVAGTWTRRVEPGAAGSIPIRFTSKFDDREIHKTIIVDSNDANQTNVTLLITGKIWNPIDVSPAVVMFGASADCQSNQTQVVRITNNSESPLTLAEPECNDPGFKCRLKTIQPGKEFELQITMLPPLKTGSVTVPVTLKTSSTNLPVINLAVFANILAPIIATPPKILLAAGPLPVATEYKVTLQNNSAKPLGIFKPSVNLAGVEVRLQEIQPGRRFILVASFPAGFQIPLDQNIRVQMQTSDLQLPVVTVPVVQNKSLATILSQTIRDD